MTREMAAYYVGISPTTFDVRVRSGVYPGPHEDGRYDRVALDLAVDRQSGLDADDTDGDDDEGWDIREPGRHVTRGSA
jgi:hypothetical protein